MLVEINLGPHSVNYSPKASGLTSQDLLPGQDESVERELFQADGLRRILLTLPRGTRVRMFLHWNNNAAPEDLDRSVISGEPCDRYLRGALVGGDMRLHCKKCDAAFVGVVADTGNGLLEDLALRLQQHEFIESCPQCGAQWQPHVLQVIPLPVKGNSH